MKAGGAWRLPELQEWLCGFMAPGMHRLYSWCESSGLLVFLHTKCWPPGPQVKSNFAAGVGCYVAFGEEGCLLHRVGSVRSLTPSGTLSLQIPFCRALAFCLRYAAEPGSKLHKVGEAVGGRRPYSWALRWTA